MAEEKNSNDFKPFIFMTIIDFAFAVVNILLKEVLDQGMNHLVLITYRLAVSSIFLAPIGYFFERNCRPKLTFRALCMLFLSGLVGASLSQYFFLLGIQYTSATFACAFINITPVMTFIMALPFRMEGLNTKSSSGKAKILGAVVCVGGAVTLTLYRGKTLFNSHSQALAHGSDHYNAMMSPAKRTKRWLLSSIPLFFGVTCWSSWFLLQSHIGKIYPCKYTSTAFMSFFGAIQSASLVSLSNGRNLSIWILKGKLEIFTVLFSGVVGSGLCYVGMSWCVEKRGPVFTAAFSPLVQIMAAMIDIPILHEPLHLGSLLGSILVIIGLYILLWGKNKEIQEKANKASQDEGKAIKEPQQTIQVVTVSTQD